jgi:hypothetical protein
MAYSTLVLSEGVSSEFLVVLNPSRKVTSWTDLGSNQHSNNFTLGYVGSVTIDGVAQTLIASSAVSSGEYYWDNANQLLYIYSTGTASDFIVVTYELYYSTKGAHFPRIPTSAKSTTNVDVYFDPAVIKSASFKASLTDSLMGYLPSQSSNIIIGNPDHTLENHLYESSFSQKAVQIYHWLGDLETANIKKLLDGRMKNIRYSTDKLTINILDRVDIFNAEYRNTNNSFYSTSDFAGVDPGFVGRPIRFVYGRADNVRLVNLDQELNAPTTSNNRIWSVREGAANTYTGVVSAAPASTATRTYLEDTSGIDVGDLAWLDKAADEYVLITAVSRTGSEYVEHATLSGANAQAADTLKRGTLGNLYVNQGGTRYPCHYNRDYTESVSNNVVIVTLKAGAEASMGISTLDGSEEVDGRIYGEQNDVTKGGSGFGSDSAQYNSLTNPAVILFDLMKQVGIAEADIDLTSFDTLSTQISGEEIGFALPANLDGDFPTYKTLLTDIFRSNLVQLFLNTDGKWEVDYLKVLPTQDVTIDKTEILVNTISYRLDYNDLISDVIISYRYRELYGSGLTKSTTSNTAKYLHGVSKQKTFKTYLIDGADATTLGTRLADIFGDRRGSIEFTCKNRFFNNYIGDIIQVSLEKHVGFSYTEGTENTRSYEIIDIDKSSNTVKLKCSDNKGIEDNSGDF